MRPTNPDGTRKALSDFSTGEAIEWCLGIIDSKNQDRATVEGALDLARTHNFASEEKALKRLLASLN